MRHVKFTREAMYALVWEKPVLTIAKEIGVADLVVSRACRKAGVPLPPAGYWAAVRAGKTRPVPPLTAAEPGQMANVEFWIWDNLQARPPRINPAALPSIDVPRELTHPHPLVTQFKAAAERAHTHDGILAVDTREVMRVRTSAGCLARALLLLDTLLKEFERQGVQVQVGKGRFGCETMLRLKEGEISFSLAELTRQAPPPEEDSRLSFVLVATGRFAVTFGFHHGQGVRFHWRDKPGRSLEQQLPEVLASVPSWEAALRQQRIEREEEKARFRREEEQWQAEAQRREVLRKQRTRLVEHLDAWERAVRLRQFVAAVAAAGEDTETTRAWLRWAEEQIAQLDPLCDIADVTSFEVSPQRYYPGYGGKPPTDWWD